MFCIKSLCVDCYGIDDENATLVSWSTIGVYSVKEDRWLIDAHSLSIGEYFDLNFTRQIAIRHLTETNFEFMLWQQGENAIPLTD